MYFLYELSNLRIGDTHRLAEPNVSGPRLIIAIMKIIHNEPI